MSDTDPFRCMCGDICCPSCGPAQGNHRCPICGKWESEGGCDNPDACQIAEKKQLQAEEEGDIHHDALGEHGEPITIGDADYMDPPYEREADAASAPNADSVSYDYYVEACVLSGKVPLEAADWVEAGKPKG